MWKPIAVTSLISMSCCAAFAQKAPAAPAPPPPEFEVATIRPSQTAGGFAYSVGVQFDPGLVRMNSMSLENCIEWAYKLNSYQLSGPDWMKSDHYDITAKMPAGATQEQFPAMLQKLLEQRFQLKSHRESKVLPAYALVVASGGLKMHPSKTRQGGTTQWGIGHVEAHETPLSSLAASLYGWVDRPVVDETGVPGVFDFTLDWAEDEEHEAAGLPSIRVALEEKLGLKLEPRKLPVDTFVIDHLEKKPSEN
jgi:uncharacterized protein (TIGR03435 family)